MTNFHLKIKENKGASNGIKEGIMEEKTKENSVLC